MAPPRKRGKLAYYSLRGFENAERISIAGMNNLLRSRDKLERKLNEIVSCLHSTLPPCCNGQHPVVSRL